MINLLYPKITKYPQIENKKNMMYMILKIANIVIVRERLKDKTSFLLGSIYKK